MLYMARITFDPIDVVSDVQIFKLLRNNRNTVQVDVVELDLS